MARGGADHLSSSYNLFFSSSSWVVVNKVSSAFSMFAINTGQEPYIVMYLFCVLMRHPAIPASANLWLSSIILCVARNVIVHDNEGFALNGREVLHVIVESSFNASTRVVMSVCPVLLTHVQKSFGEYIWAMVCLTQLLRCCAAWLWSSIVWSTERCQDMEDC